MSMDYTLPPPPASGAHRLPPYSLDAELAVLGALMVAPDVIHDVRAVVEPEDFWRETHRTLARRLYRLAEERRSIDLVVVEEDLRRSGDLDRIGGMDALTAAVERGACHWLAAEHAATVRRKAVLRRLIEAAGKILDDAYADADDERAVASRAESLILAAAEGIAASRVVEWADAVRGAMDRIAARSRGERAGLSTGLDGLDDLIGGLAPGRLVVLAARPGMGKTAMALGMAEWISLSGAVVLIVSKEMGAAELAERSIASASGIGVARVQRPRTLDWRHMDKLWEAAESISGLPIAIDESSGGSPSDVASVARRMRSRSGLGLVVVDYIQLLESEPSAKSSRESRQEAVAKISGSLKRLARELDVPVLALSQLNRAVEMREDRRPRMADLRESGAIEQDADQVVLLHRPEYYDPNEAPGEAELIVAKNRHGPTGTVAVAFDKQLTRFHNLYADNGLVG